MSLQDLLVLIRGAGDLASGVAYRLCRCGFPVVMTEVARPLALRRAVAFAQAIYDGEATVEGVTAINVDSPQAAREVLASGAIPILVDPEAACRLDLRPVVLVDAILAKASTTTRLTNAPLVIGLGPGFLAGVDCHAVIETMRGHDLGRVLWHGSALADTGTPGEVGGQSEQRVLRAPCAGVLNPHHAIGELLRQGELIGTVNSKPVYAPFDGVLRGLIHPSVPLYAGMKIGDVDPRGISSHCFTISDKALSIGSGVLEAILSAPQLEPLRRR